MCVLGYHKKEGRKVKAGNGGVFLSAKSVGYNTPFFLLHGFCQYMRASACELRTCYSIFSGDEDMQR
jgi:hypothetical protein